MNSSRKPSFIDACADFVIRRRFPLIGALLVLTVLAGSGASKLQVQTTFRIWHQDDAPEIKAYDKMTESFGSDDLALVAFQDSKGVLRNESLESIVRLTEKFWAVKDVKRVDSLSNFPMVKASRPGDESPALLVHGDYVLAASEEGEVRAWRVGTWEERSLKGHEAMVEHLIAGRVPEVVYSGSLDRTVKAWNTSAGSLTRTYHGAPHGVSSLAISEDGSRVIAGSYRKVLVWDEATGKRLNELEGHADYVTAVAVAGDTLITAGQELIAWKLSTGEKIGEWATGTSFVTEMLYSRGRGAVVVAFDNGAVSQWVVSSGQRSELLPAGTHAALSLAESSDGKVLYVGMADGTARRIEAGATAASLKLHEGWVMDLAVAPGGQLVSVSQDMKVAVVDQWQQAPRALRAHRGLIRRVLVGADGAFYTSGDDAAVYVWGAGAEGAVGGRLVARLERHRSEQVAPVPAVNGEPVGVVAFTNAFPHEVEVYVAQQARGQVAPGQTLEIKGLPVGPRASCAVDACPSGLECDYEEAEPVCKTPVVVEAKLVGGTAAIWASKRSLPPAEPLRVKAPSEDAFSVQEVALAPMPAEARVGALLTAYPQQKVKSVLGEVAGAELIADPMAHIQPSVALAAAEALSGAQEEEARAATFLEQLGRRALEPNRLPIQPFRLREARFALTRGPVPPGLGAVINEPGDASLLAISVHQQDHAQALERMVDVRSALEQAVEKESAITGLKYHLTGDVISDTSFKEYAEKDMERLVPLFFGLIALILIALYRRPAGLLIPVLMLVVTVVMTMGAAGHLGASINNLTSAVPQVVLAVCVANAIHLFTSYTQQLRQGSTSVEAVRYAVAHNLAPCFWTSLTTAIGFFSLVTNPIGPVADFGWMSGIGVSVGFLSTFMLLPGIMSLLPVPKRFKLAPPEEKKAQQQLSGPFVALARWVNSKTWPILIVSAVLVAVGLYGAMGAHFDTNPIRNFKPGAPFRDASDFVEKHISGPVNVEIVFETGEPLGTRKVEHLRKIEKLVEHIRKTPEVTNVTALSDIHKSMNRVFNGDVDSRFLIPDTDGEASAAFTAYSLSLPAGMDLTNRVDEDESATRISVRMHSRTSGWILAWERELADWARQNLPGVNVSVTGKFVIWATMNSALNSSFLLNVGSAVLLIGLVMILIMRSLRLGLVSMVPNMLPAALTIGVIGLLDLPMDVSILVSVCVALGIAVDDTIHILAKYREQRLAHPEQTHDEAVLWLFKSSASALTATTVVLCVGFSVFMWTNFQINSNFGLTCAVMLAIALVVDLTLTPALLKVAAGKPKASGPSGEVRSMNSPAEGSEAGAASGTAAAAVGLASKGEG